MTKIKIRATRYPEHTVYTVENWQEYLAALGRRGQAQPAQPYGISISHETAENSKDLGIDWKSQIPQLFKIAPEEAELN